MYNNVFYCEKSEKKVQTFKQVETDEPQSENQSWLKWNMNLLAPSKLFLPYSKATFAG